MNTIYLMVGIPGSGKTTWIKNRIKETGEGIHISRDEVRFSLLRENDPYFKNESTVFAIFIQQINRILANNSNEVIYVDATHINETGRKRVLDKLILDNARIIPIVFKTSVKKCISRREKSEGREYVPASVIRDMNKRFRHPKYDVYYKYDDIIEVTT